MIDICCSMMAPGNQMYEFLQRIEKLAIETIYLLKGHKS